MTRLYKYLIWFYMLTKRLLRQWSFIILLCLIPVSILLTTLVMSEDSGIVHVLLCNEENDEVAEQIIKELTEKESVLRFSICDSSLEAENLIKNKKADCAWVFSADFSERIEASDFSDPFVTIIEKEPSTQLNIAKEKLFGAMYKHFSYSLYEEFMYKELVSEKEVPKKIAKEYYNNFQKGNEIIKIESLDEEANTDKNNLTYLTAPLRGILSLMVILCVLTATLYYLKEASEGKFSWLSPQKRIIPAIASCFSAACLSSIAMVTTIQFTDISVGFLKELATIFPFIIAATGFAALFSLLFRSYEKFGALIPGIVIITLILSPIFFNMKILRPVRLMLPTYYYLKSIYDPSYYLYTAYYCFGVYAIIFILNKILAGKRL